MTLTALGHICATVVVGLGFIWTLRRVSRRSRTIATLMGLGVAGRLLLAVSLFWLSYLRFEPLGRLHTGDGFWRLAPDALWYFLRAAAVWEHGGWPLDPQPPSASYVHLLSFWMFVTGPTVPGAVLLNVAAYIGTCVLLVAALDPRRGPAQARACTVSVAAFTFSPASIVFGSQTLKDAAFTFFLMVTCVAILAFPGGEPRLGRRGVARTLAISGVGLAAFVLAGMRSYFPFLQMFAMGLALVAWALRMGRAAWAPAQLAPALTLVAVTWACFALGAGSRYYTYERLLVGDLRGTAVLRSQRAPGLSAANALDWYREGFVTAGGATNVVWKGLGRNRERAGGPAGLAQGAVEKAATVLVGLLVMFVPISLLRLTGLIGFEGGRGLLVVTDLDTMYLVLSTLAVAFVMQRYWRPDRRNVPYAVFTVSFAILLAVPMAYVVTNFGTLFRLRLIVAALIWATPLALATPATLAGVSAVAGPRADAAPVRHGTIG